MISDNSSVFSFRSPNLNASLLAIELNSASSFNIAPKHHLVIVAYETYLIAICASLYKTNGLPNKAIGNKINGIELIAVSTDFTEEEMKSPSEMLINMVKSKNPYIINIFPLIPTT